MSWRRILLLSLVFVVALAAATVAVLQNSEAATRLVAHELQSVFATPATIEGTSLDVPSGRLSIRGLRVADPARPAAALATVDTVDLDVSANPFGTLLGMHAVTITGLDVQLGRELPTADQVFLASGKSGGDEPLELPPIDLRDARLRFTVRSDQPPVELRDVDASLSPVANQPHCAELTGTAQLAELSALLHLRGNIDFRTGAARLAVSTRDVALGRSLLDRLQSLFAIDLGSLDADARIRELTFACNVPGKAEADRTPVFEVAAELDGVRVAAKELPPLIERASVSLHATSRGDGAVTLRLQQESATGTFDITAQATGPAADPVLDVRATGKNIVVNDDVIAALRTFAVGRDVVEALRPTAGRADVELFLQNPQRRGGITELELSLRDVAMAYHGFGDPATRASFPLPLVRARGRVRLRDDVVMLEGLDAEIAPFAGGGTVRMTGRIDTVKPGGEDATLDIHAGGVEFTPHLRTALTALLRDDGKLYDRFAPTGRTEVSVQVRPRSVTPTVWSVEVRPTAATMQWAGFPYRLDGLTGSVHVRSDGASFDLEGRHGEGTLAMHGRLPIDSEHESEGIGFEAVVELKNVAIDDDLRIAVAVIAKEVEIPWRNSAARGRIGGQVKVWRPRAADPLFHDIRLDLDGVDLKLPTAPWRARDLHGQMFAQGSGAATRIDFDALRGQLDHGNPEAAQLAMLGSLVTGGTGDGVDSDLAFVVRGLQLDEQLGHTLQELGALGDSAWRELKPSGTVDLVCRHERSATGENRLRLVVQLVDVDSESPILLRPAHGMTGELSIADGELRFRDLRGEMGGAQMYFSDGRVRTRPAPDGRTEIAFRVKANGIPVDDGLANLFSGPLRQAVLDRKLDGRADVDSLAIEFAIPVAGCTLPFETRIGGQVRLYDVDMSLGSEATGAEQGVRVEGISGVVTIADSVVSDTGGGLTGTLNGGSFRLFGQPLEAVEAAFAADAQRIELAALTSRFHGGSVRSGQAAGPALDYLLPGPSSPTGRLSANLLFEKVDAYSFLAACGWQNPPYSGVASGEFVLDRLDGSNIIDALATGRLTIERADLGVVPLFTAIYAQLPAPDRPRFNHLEAVFRLADKTVTFEKLDVRSNLLGVNGEGTLGLDGYLDIRMQLDNLLGTSADPLVMPLLDEFAKGILRFHLFGYLRDLRTERRWVTERSPARRQVLPMPPPVERLPLPDY